MFVINATDYAPIDPLTPPCEVNQINIGYVGENHARCLVFDLTECVAQFGEGGFAISFIRHGDYLPYLVTDTDRLENNAIWLINSTDTAVEGYGMVQLQYIVGTTVVKSALYQTVTFASNEIPGNVPDPYEDLLTQIAAYAATAEGAATTATAAAEAASTAVENGITTERSQRIAADNSLQLQITELMGLAGAPSMASTAAAMTDSNKVYVYTGNEAGYLTGHWYYYNGTEWTDGGVYQATAVDTDKTLTVSNMAADAAVVGEKIDECMAAFVTETTSGSVCSFDDGADNVPVKDLTVNITAIQTGTGDPSPDNIRPIIGYNKAEIVVSGVNTMPTLVSGRSVNANSGNNTGTASDGISINCATEEFIPVNLKASTYMYGYDSDATLPAAPSSQVFCYDADKHYLGYIVSSTARERPISMASAHASGTFDNAEVCYIKIRYYFASGSGNTWTQEMCDNAHFRINPGETLNDYVPYEAANVYPISFGSAGTIYGGTLDVTSGMLTVTHKGIVISDDTMYSTRSLGWSTGTNANRVGVPIKPTILPIDGSASGDRINTGELCNMGTISEVGVASDYTVGKWQLYRGSDCWFFRFCVATTYTTADAAYAYLKTNNCTFTAPLNNPVSYQLSPTEVKTILGQNNIWCNTGDITSLEYRADTKLYIEHLTHPDGDMVADANIANGSYFMVNNRLYIATAAIASGASIVPGTNCTETNLAAALNAINA